MYVCMYAGRCTHHGMHVEARGQLEESVLTCCHVGLRDETQDVRPSDLARGAFTHLSHFVSIFFKWGPMVYSSGYTGTHHAD